MKQSDINLILSYLQNISTEIKIIKSDIEMIRRDLNEAQAAQVKIDEDLIGYARTNLARSTKVLRAIKDE